ncbi:hypothetical protein [Dictyobacter alpinus]|nr:hypothetical protein [Dictyobacter alpinus]
MQQNLDEQIHHKQRERTIIKTMYAVQRGAFYLYIGLVLLLFLTIFLGFLARQTPWGAFLLSTAVPWKWIVPSLLVIGFLFIFTDTFIQSREEAWFQLYGSQVLTKVVAFDEVRSFRWARRFFSDWTEYRLRLEWTSPETGQVYNFSQRVRDRKLPVMGAQIPVVLDLANPTYYLQADFKRSYR